MSMYLRGTLCGSVEAYVACTTRAAVYLLVESIHVANTDYPAVHVSRTSRLQAPASSDYRVSLFVEQLSLSYSYLILFSFHLFSLSETSMSPAHVNSSLYHRHHHHPSYTCVLTLLRFARRPTLLPEIYIPTLSPPPGTLWLPQTFSVCKLTSEHSKSIQPLANA